jgi:hypothetical protein
MQMEIAPSRLRLESKAWLELLNWYVASGNGPGHGPVSRQPLDPHVVGHPVIYLSLSGEEHRGFVRESNHFLFSLAVGFPFAHGLCPFFGGAFTGQVLHDACMHA